MASPFDLFLTMRNAPHRLGGHIFVHFILPIVVLILISWFIFFSKSCNSNNTYSQRHAFGAFHLFVTAEPIDESLSHQLCTLDIQSSYGKTIEFEINGGIVDSWTADLDDDSSPEVYIWTQSAGSGSQGELHIYEWTTDYAPRPLLELTSSQMNGYMGHDEYEVQGTEIVRRFPLYRPGDPNATPSGGVRELHYILVQNLWNISRVEDLTE